MQKRYYYSYKEFLEDVPKLYNKIQGFNPDSIIAISRGGLTLSHYLAILFNIRKVYTINSIFYEDQKRFPNIRVDFSFELKEEIKKILIVDDIVDTGKTAKEVLEILKDKYPKKEFKLATIFYKLNSPILPDFALKEANKWIDFFWEVDLKGIN